MAKLTKFVWIFLLILGLSAAIVRCEEEETPESEDEEDEPEVKEEEDVLVLTTKNFDDVVDSKDTILVEFYAPWCGHCKSLAPEYAKAAATLKKNDPPVPLAKVDATAETDLATRFDVSGYPTMKWFKRGTAYDYDGPREEDGIVQFMKERADPNWKPPPDVVFRLTKDNFTEVINREELILVQFYAPWCGHCKKLAPEYEQAAKQLMQQDPPIPLAKIDATVNAEIASEYGVTGYPTLKMFRKGRVSEYKGQREKFGIINYMIQQQGEAAKLLADVKAIKAFMSNDDATIIGFFDNLNDPRLKLYMDAANDMREDHKFGYTLNEEGRNTYKINPGSVVVFTAERFYTKFEPKWHTLHKDELTVDDVTNFVKNHHLPLVGEYSHSSSKYYTNLEALCLVFYTVDWTFDHREATQLWRRKVAEVAKDYKGEIVFAVADEDSQSSLVKEFNLDDSGEELSIGIIDKNNRKYKMDPMEEFDADEFKEFLDKYKKGKIPPQIRSQPIPKKQGIVKTVVGKTFDKIVLDPTKDVLIELYAPWCGHCKQLEPVYKDLAKKYKKEKNLVIAKIDATSNEAPPAYKVEGFPTIYFAPSDNKDSPLKFGESRDLDGFSKFLEKHATVSLGKSKKDEL